MMNLYSNHSIEEHKNIRTLMHSRPVTEEGLSLQLWDIFSLLWKQDDYAAGGCVKASPAEKEINRWLFV